MHEPRPISSDEEEGVWRVEHGAPETRPETATYVAEGVENLTYSNPFALTIERVWFDGKIVFAVEQGELDVDVNAVKVAQEYQVVYSVDLDAQGKLAGGKEPERVPGQYNIYDSVPGMDKYSPLWQFNYVIVPQEYVPNTLRSEADCLGSGYPIRKSTVIEN